MVVGRGETPLFGREEAYKKKDFSHQALNPILVCPVFVRNACANPPGFGSGWTGDFWSKGRPPSTDLRYGEEDSISSSTLIFAAIKG